MIFTSTYTTWANAQRARGFTLIETMIAISMLAVAIVAPMSLASRSLMTAYYSRDQVTAFYLAQEALESVRAIRDGNVLQYSQGTNTDLLNGIPVGLDFVIDTRTNQTWTTCTANALKSDGTFYGYGTDPCLASETGWIPTAFRRVVHADYVAGTTNEIRLTVTVTWSSGGLPQRSFTMQENLYRWVNDGSGAR